MKLQYRETKWWAGEVPESCYPQECKELQKPTHWLEKESRFVCKCRSEEVKAISQFKEIAPQDQEKVKELLWRGPKERPYSIENVKRWQPIEGKLYDLGDLVFDLQWFQWVGMISASNTNGWKLEEAFSITIIDDKFKSKYKI